MRTIVTLISVLTVLAAGCRDKDASNDVDAAPGGDGGGDDVKIQDIQDDNMPVGQAVTVRGVVVVHVDTFGSRTGGLFIQEPEGGEFSGVFVFLTGTQAAGLVPGDLVDVLGGEKDEFALSADTSGRTLTEIVAPQGGSITINKVGTGTVPTPPVLNPWDLAASDVEAEKWEGVTVTFQNVAVLRAPRMVTQSDPTILEMVVTGPFPAQNSLTQLEDTLMRDDCLASLTGIVDYFFDYKLLPRTAADIVTGGTSCPAQEEGEEACSDSMDNDYDGFADCADFSCQETVAACTTDTTVVAIQDGTVAENTAVSLTDVVVTAVDFNRKNLWVADAATAAANNGVYVFRGFSSASVLPTEIVVGATVDVSGTVDEYFNMTEITGPTVTFKSAPGAAPTALGPIAYAELVGDNTVGEIYEGVLIRIENVAKVSTLTFNRFTVGEAGSELIIGQEVYRHIPAETECYASITGVLHHTDIDDSQATDFRRALMPRSAADVVTQACP